MMTQLKRGIPPRATVAVLALALLATIVSGREPTERPPPAAMEQRVALADTAAHDDDAGLRLATRLETAGLALAPRAEALPAHTVLSVDGPAPPPAEEPRSTVVVRRPA